MSRRQKSDVGRRAPQRILVGDIGGSNIRLALAERRPAGWRLSAHLTGATHPGLDLAEILHHYLWELGQPAVQACAICAAGPPESFGRGETRIRLTNLRSILTTVQLRTGAGVEHAVLLNDFTALALSLPLLKRGDLRQLGKGRPEAGAAMAVVGPGTGLGVSALIPHATGYACVVGEGGHANLSLHSADELAVWRLLRRDSQPLDAEEILSGPGLVRLYTALARLRSAQSNPLTAEQIARQAMGRRNAVARESLRIFTQWLGRFAGDVALIYGARAGVYLAGGILPAWGAGFNARLFRRGFEDKGNFAGYVKRIPTWLITHPQPALLGLAQAAAGLELS